MLHASETWPLTKPNRQHLQQNDRTMVTQICNARPQDVVTTRSNELLAWLGTEDLDLILKERRLHWYGHVERSNGAVKTAFHLQAEGKRGPGRLQDDMEAAQLLTVRDCREWKLLAINPHDRTAENVHTPKPHPPSHSHPQKYHISKACVMIRTFHFSKISSLNSANPLRILTPA